MRFVRWALGVAVVQGALLLLLAWLLDGFSVITLATVGYGDFAPRTTLGKLFTVGYVLVGVGLLGSFLSFLPTRRPSSREAAHLHRAASARIRRLTSRWLGYVLNAQPGSFRSAPP